MNNTTAVVEQVVNSKLKVKTTKNIISSGFTILVYGESGTGKTFDIQFVKNPFVISAEGGLLTLNNTDLANWGTDDTIVMQAIATKLNLTISEYVNDYSRPAIN